MSNKRVNAGYDIINAMQVENEFGRSVEVVMGHNEKAPSPYATWSNVPGEESYVSGHYFSEKGAAMKDFFERGLSEAEVNLRAVYRKENMLGDIEAAMDYSLSGEMKDAMLEHPEFLKRAEHLYDNVDHSGENEALQDGIENIISEMVSEHLIFEPEVFEALEGKVVAVLMEDGTTVTGENIWHPKDDLTYFCLDVAPIEDGKKMKSEMCEIGKISEIEVDGNLLFSKRFDKEQMVQIQAGYQEGLTAEQVASYADPNLFAEDMEKRRKTLKQQSFKETLRKVLVTDGMDGCSLIATDAPRSFLEDWAKAYCQAIQNDKYKEAFLASMFSDAGYSMVVLYDSAEGVFDVHDLDWDESFDLDEYWEYGEDFDEKNVPVKFSLDEKISEVKDDLGIEKMKEKVTSRDKGIAL